MSFQIGKPVSPSELPQAGRRRTKKPARSYVNDRSSVDPSYYTNETQIQMKIRDKVEDCLNLVNEKLKTNLEVPEILYDLRGTCAGQACYRGRVAHLRYNLVLALENEEEYLKETVPHEVAHLVVFYQYCLKGVLATSHGYHWKFIMRLLGCKPERCHSYDTSNSKVRELPRVYVYKCGCKNPTKLTQIRHKRLMRGTTYRCGSCNRQINRDSYAGKENE